MPVGVDGALRELDEAITGAVSAAAGSGEKFSGVSGPPSSHTVVMALR
jgi:hypothetical protein